MKQNMKKSRESLAFSENPQLNIMEKIARKSAMAFKHAFSDIERKLVTKEGAFTLASDTDSKMQMFFKQELEYKAPEDAIVFSHEETLPTEGNVWFVSTTGSFMNLAHGYEAVNISFAYVENGEAKCALVYYPLTDQIFAIEKGKGAYSKEGRLRVSGKDMVENCLISIFSPVSRTKDEDAYFKLSKMARSNMCHVRTSGNLIDDCIMHSQGRLDAILSINLNPVDVFIGQFIIRESGGSICDMSGKLIELGSTEILAANSKLQGKFLKLLASS